MLQNRTWVDPQAEAEFWKQMERLETATARLSSSGRLGGLLTGAPWRRAALKRDIDIIQRLAQDLVDRHTIPVSAAPIATIVPEAPASTSDAPLRTLASMVVSLRQDRAIRPEVGEEKTV